ncbi:hypothetical protein ENSA5_03790 [Enhygromyxa salina]|uniref:Uncharacterized protein n=1 Tax=Enhygromyxa salina TaxID=215803 RepID=A0A2S9YJM5_9BACT|nr:hypothetical protein ENSA5_03790 [Enhygromyxa salina]
MRSLLASLLFSFKIMRGLASARVTTIRWLQ